MWFCFFQRRKLGPIRGRGCEFILNEKFSERIHRLDFTVARPTTRPFGPTWTNLTKEAP